MISFRCLAVIQDSILFPHTDACVSPVPPFVGQEGKTVTGSVVPAVEGVRIEVLWHTDYDSGKLEALTDEDGMVRGVEKIDVKAERDNSDMGLVEEVAAPGLQSQSVSERSPQRVIV